MSTDLHAAVPDHLSALLADLTRSQQRLRTEMTTGFADHPTAGPNPKHIAMGESLAKSTIALSRELRAWSKATKEASKNLSIGERISLVVSFIHSLSEADRREFNRLLQGEE